VVVLDQRKFAGKLLVELSGFQACHEVALQLTPQRVPTGSVQLSYGHRTLLRLAFQAIGCKMYGQKSSLNV
jgi:hypothetical protein